MLTTSRIAALAGVIALVIIGCMSALAQQTQQHIRQQLGDAIEALEQEKLAEAERALRDALTDLEGEAAPGEREQLRVLIEAALNALENEDYATARQTIHEAEELAGQQQAVAPIDTGPPLVLPGATPSRGIGGGSAIGDRAIRAARLFAGPGQFPPESFAAYGIVAFRARAPTPAPAPAPKEGEGRDQREREREEERKRERERHVMLCEAYVAALPRSAELTVPVEKQMATVWPINDVETAKDMNTLTGTDICETAVGSYGLATALQAISDAGEARLGRDRRGPFLLAWSPTDDKGKQEALMLVADLSDVTTYSQAEAFFVLWRTDIEAKPEIWNRGWNVERLRVAIQLWVDRFGSQIFSVLGG